MTEKDTPAVALQEAIDFAGGQAKLAAQLGVGQSAVGNWLARGVPDDQCVPVEKATGVKVERLRPELPWHRDIDGHIYVRMTA